MFVFFVDFAPWLIWWVLVGNVRTPVTAALVALGTALALTLTSLLQRRGLKLLPIGSGVVFAVIALLGLVIGEARLLPWVQLIACGGVLLVVLFSLATGRPFTLERARDQFPGEIVRLPSFLFMNRVVTGVWALAFAVLAGLAAVPPLVARQISINDDADAVGALTILSFWVLPCIVFGLALVFASWYPGWYASRTLNRRLQGYFQQHPPPPEAEEPPPVT